MLAMVARDDFAPSERPSALRHHSTCCTMFLLFGPRAPVLDVVDAMRHVCLPGHS
jgi:hypothetical protein